MKMQMIAAAVLFAGVAGSTILVAEEGAKEGRKGKADRPKMARFEEWDKDANGALSLEEFKAMHEKKAEMMKEKRGDAPADKPMPTAEEVFTKLDTDKSGGISKEELAARTPRREHKKKAE